MTAEALEKKIRDTICDKQLFDKHSRIFVAISGGADSVCLLSMLNTLGYECMALHCNFHLRKDESDRDQRFVENLCRKLNVPIKTRHFDTAEYAKANKISIEMAARELRYAWFEECHKEYSDSVVAIAHHADDNIETFMLNLVRGTGINGLKGMKMKNGYIVRPLLLVSRQDIIGYLAEKKLDYVTDSTNLETIYKRNKIRLELLTLIKTINPSACTAMLNTMEHLSQVYDIYDQSIKESIGRVVKGNAIQIRQLKKETSPEAVLYEILNRYNFNPQQIKDIFRDIDGISGKIYYSKTNRLIRNRNELIIAELSDERNCDTLIFDFFNYSAYLPIGIVTYNVEEYHKDYAIDKNPDYAYLDYERLPEKTIYARRWQKGDKFVPFGMTGRKNVSDFLTDTKVRQDQKDEIFVVCSGNEIVWLIGKRSDNRFRITEKTRKVLKLKFQK